MDRTEDGHNSTYCIPVGLTNLQKDLIEILVSMHARSLLELSKEGALPKDEEDTNHAKLMLPALSPFQLTNMLAANIRAVANHPCLLVEHYMPRQLLLMEPAERLMAGSAKFQKLATILNSLLSRDREKFSKPLQILVIAQGIKELDLIEGFCLGKPVKLKRLSGTSLFDEKHLYGEINTGSSTPVPSSGYNKDEYERVSRKSRNNSKIEGDWLFLATTTHITRSSNLMDEFNVDLAIGFDPLVDENLSCFKRMRLGGKKVPLVKLLVQDSPDHYALACRSSENSDDLLLDSLKHFLLNRQSINGDLDFNWTNTLVDELLKAENLDVNALPSCKLADSKRIKSLVECVSQYPGLSPLSENFKLSPVNRDLDIKDYQSILMDIIVRRLKACENDFDSRQRQVLEARLRETMRQDEFDSVKVQAAKTFKEMESDKSHLNDSIKTLDKVQTAHAKIFDNVKVISERSTAFQNILVASEASPAGQIVSLQEKLASLKSELTSETLNNSRKSSANDDLRVKYQVESSEAANRSLTLKALQEKRTEIKAKSAGPITTIHKGTSNEQELQLREELIRVVQQSQFIQGYIKKVQKHYSLNGNASPKKTPNGSRTRRGRNID
ncbi:LADA_0E06920g1_1 [Lachancea dasiensis]|uniref:LADA_0E06920g1_1 n=1 Tax=Lachancea dasiensis TaxID=1072105 RepID=A0A1G4JCQ3_9SACH|nr:LADA_0E06920g1_1 [Lachancea dasiensis]